MASMKWHGKQLFTRFAQVMVTANGVDGPKLTKGVILALLSAFFYASYLVLVKYKSDTEEKVDIPLFFGKCAYLHLLLAFPRMPEPKR